MTNSLKVLSEIIIHMKYARVKENGKKETWEEIVERNLQMHLKHYKKVLDKNPELKQELINAYELVKQKIILPSMRSMQFAGKAIEQENARMYNCSYLPINSVKAFGEVMYLCLCGVGVGYSVSKQFISKLPKIEKLETKPKIYTVEDSIEGWANVILEVIGCCYLGEELIVDYSKIRPKGTILKTGGGFAPGHEPLKKCIENIKDIFNKCKNKQLNSLEVHDILCHISDAVVSGGVRRSALICLFDYDDELMLNCKQGEFWNTNPQRARANNSVILKRGKITKDQFKYIFNRCKESGVGEPGFFWTNDTKMGCNPCAEIALNPNQFCNLVEIDFGKLEDINYGLNTTNKELKTINILKSATLIATFQAGYTDFNFINKKWKKQTEKEALIGVGLTGICAKFDIDWLNLKKYANNVVNTNKIYAEKLGIKSAARTTTIKPAGTTSTVLGTSSGIHAYYDKFYIRRVRVGKNEAIYKYILNNFPDIVEDDEYDSKNTAVLSFPIKAPENAITSKKETALEVLERVKLFYDNWIKQGHLTGNNTNNISVTVYVDKTEWNEVFEWMWNNQDSYTAISLLPKDEMKYKQAPFESISEYKYKKMSKYIKNLNLDNIQDLKAEDDITIDISACSGGSCEIM